MAGLATEAGVSRQLVYDHFPDVDSLYEQFVEDRLARYRDAIPDLSGLNARQAASAMFHHLLAIPATDRRVVRLLVADVGLVALARVRERFRREELARWPALTAGSQPAGTASAVIWTTTSALLALADSVTTGDISAADADALAVAIVRASRRSGDSEPVT